MRTCKHCGVKIQPCSCGKSTGIPLHWMNPDDVFGGMFCTEEADALKHQPVDALTALVEAFTSSSTASLIPARKEPPT